MPKLVWRIMHYALLVAVGGLFLVPLLWLLVLAVRPAEITASNPLQFAFVPDFASFGYVLRSAGGASSLLASTIQAVATTLIALPLAIMATYALTRWKYKGRNALGLAYLALVLAPAVVFVIPLFILLSEFGLVGTNIGVVIAFQTFGIPFGVLLLKNFFEDLPVELEEAAMLDGCTRAGILLRIFLPVLRPGLMVAGIFIFCFSWNNLLLVMPLTGGDSIPLTVRALSFFATSGVSWSYIGATAIISALPPMILFFLFRKNIVSGLTFGAVK
ncbi:MAG: carbohydrate ABC transporter permease [Propionibacteriaceae bacterium]